MSIRRRLERLEERGRTDADAGAAFGRALSRLSDEDLEALAELLDHPEYPDEGAGFRRLHEAADARGRAALDALFAAMGPARQEGRAWGA